MQFLLFPSCSTLLLLLCALPARADWVADVGYVKLQAELGAACPKGVGVKITQVEAPISQSPLSYAPVAGTGSVVGTGGYIGKTFLLKSGTSAFSFHAEAVGNLAYSQWGLASGVANVDVYEVNHWLQSGFLNYPTATVPLAETSQVQNHSWVALPPDSNPSTIAAYNNLLQRLDYNINASNLYLAFAGMNNYAGSTFPVLMASAYNILVLCRGND